MDIIIGLHIVISIMAILFVFWGMVAKTTEAKIKDQTKGLKVIISVLSLAGAILFILTAFYGSTLTSNLEENLVMLVMIGGALIGGLTLIVVTIVIWETLGLFK
ncbi:MAG: hypothetical protein ACFE9L_15225 [Candidatus Hodarchaeota archaeon]